MGKRAQFYFMFTDSTAKHFYGSVASMGSYYCTHTVVFVFLLLLLLAVCFLLSFVLPVKLRLGLFLIPSLPQLYLILCAPFLYLPLSFAPLVLFAFELVLIRCFARYISITHDAPYWSHKDASHLRRCICVRVSACGCVKIYVQFHGRTVYGVHKLLFLECLAIADFTSIITESHMTVRSHACKNTARLELSIVRWSLAAKILFCSKSL